MKRFALIMLVCARLPQHSLSEQVFCVGNHGVIHVGVHRAVVETRMPNGEFVCEQDRPRETKKQAAQLAH